MTILLVDDHALVRAVLKRLLTSELAVEVLEASNGHDALVSVATSRPGLVILDLNLPDLGGLELLRRIGQTASTAILVLSMHAEPFYVKRALDGGAAGYASKNISPDELIIAVKRLLSGGQYVQAEIAQVLSTQTTAPGLALEALSSRELEILRLLANGSSLAQIAKALGVSYKTVANIASQIKSKLGVSRTADLVRVAIETGVP